MYSSCSYHSKTQIASILATKEPVIKLKYIDVQMQSGQSDCGIFEIAFATALAHGLQPGNYIFQQNTMRKSLTKLFRKWQNDYVPNQESKMPS